MGVLKFMKNAALAVYDVNRTGFVSRDTKFGNLFASGKGEEEKVFLGDFGYTTLIGSRVKCAGTPGYQSPENLLSKKNTTYIANAGYDLYSLGSILYRIIFHRKFLEGNSDLCIALYESVYKWTPEETSLKLTTDVILAEVTNLLCFELPLDGTEPCGEPNCMPGGIATRLKPTVPKGAVEKPQVVFSSNFKRNKKAESLCKTCGGEGWLSIIEHPRSTICYKLKGRGKVLQGHTSRLCKESFWKGELAKHPEAKLKIAQLLFDCLQDFHDHTRVARVCGEPEKADEYRHTKSTAKPDPKMIEKQAAGAKKFADRIQEIITLIESNPKRRRLSRYTLAQRRRLMAAKTPMLRLLEEIRIAN